MVERPLSMREVQGSIPWSSSLFGRAMENRYSAALLQGRGSNVEPATERGSESSDPVPPFRSVKKVGKRAVRAPPRPRLRFIKAFIDANRYKCTENMV